MRGIGYSNSRGAARSDRDVAMRYGKGFTVHPIPVLVHGEKVPEQQNQPEAKNDV
jgi:hypothetical protein